MTHAIYIAVILVLAGAACWLWRALSREIDEHATARCDAASWAQQSEGWRDIAENQSREMLERGGQYDALRGILTDTERELDQTLARLRSYKGWNGRYRRRIAELEEQIDDLNHEVGDLEMMEAEG